MLDEHGQPADAAGNCRNGHSAKTVLGDSGAMQIEVPRDRAGSFEPLLVPKWQKKLPGLEEKIIALNARGMTVRDIKAMLEQQYHIEVSPDFISSVSDAVQAEVAEWQNRPPQRMCPLVFFDALRLRSHDEGAVRNRGVEDILIVVVDGLKGFPEAITAAFPRSAGADLHCAPAAPPASATTAGGRDAVASALKLICRAENEVMAMQRLEEFEASAWAGSIRPT